MDEDKKTPRFSGRDWLTTALGLALAALFWNVFGLRYLDETLPGLGATVFVFALFGAVLLYLGKRTVWNATSISLTAYTLALAATFTLYGADALRLLSYFVALNTGALAVFALAGKSRRSLREWRVLPATAGQSASALLGHVFAPLRALSALNGTGRRRLVGLTIGLLLCVPVLALVLTLLCSADAVFASAFNALRAVLDWQRAGENLWWVARVLLLGLLFGSALYTLSLPEKPRAAAPTVRPGDALTLPCGVVLGALDAVYVLFVGVQFAFLFGGAETAAMEGGYAAYARSGFFQLTAVACLNAAVTLFAARAAEGARGTARKLVRALAVALLALTTVILASAAWRMALYVSVYGLSLLRLLTLWVMAFVAVCLAGAGIKLFRPDFCFFALFLATGLTGWLLLATLNPTARIAAWNVDAYLDGRVEQIDYSYLAALSPDTYPALQRLQKTVGGDYTAHDADETLGEQTARMARSSREALSWRDWNVSAALRQGESTP